jgi:hypothetical protein
MIVMRYDPPGLALGLAITAMSARTMLRNHRRGRREEDEYRSEKISNSLLPLGALRVLCGESPG